MTRAEHETRIAGLVGEYNEAMQEETVDLHKVNGIEAKLKNATTESKKDAKKSVYSALLQMANPMLEAARLHHFDYPAYALVKEKGVVTGAEIAVKIASINPVELGSDVIKYGALKDCPYEKTGVVTNGHTWEYRAEKLAYLLTYRTIKKLGGSPEDVSAFRNSYAIRDLAAREKMGETPTSNTQLVKMLQSIVDVLMFVPNDKGGNAVKVNGKDAEYLLSMFEKAGRGVGQVEVLKGNKVKDYIFTVCHMVVTGKPYEVKYAQKKDDASDQPVRKPVKVSGPKKERASEEAPAEVSAPAPVPAEASDELPGMDEIMSATV